MLKKYLPFIILLAAAFLLWYVKSHQRGPGTTGDSNEHIKIPAMPPSNTGGNDFNRNVSHIIYSKHARCRMICRHIDETEVKEILEKGSINYSKVEEDERGKTFPLEGITHDNQHVRIVFAPKQEVVEVVTCIDLDTDWPCDCR